MYYTVVVTYFENRVSVCLYIQSYTLVLLFHLFFFYSDCSYTVQYMYAMLSSDLIFAGWVNANTHI